MIQAPGFRRFFLQSSAATAAASLLGACGVTAPSRPATAVDSTVWRTHGQPLLAGAAGGPLAGLRVAVKDLFAVQGQVVGGGNPAWLAQQTQLQAASAEAVQRLLDAGAVVQGMARTDEFAYSLAGTNGHYGTPPNPRAPTRISGGSTSGAASAVALGQADVGLGTDTGGSIRIPSSYQGLWGIRPSHGAVPVKGLVPLAPSFDTVGWICRDAGTLQRVGGVLLSARSAQPLRRVVMAPSLMAVADAPLAELLAQALGTWGGDLPRVESLAFDTAPLAGWVKAFQTRQGWEAWRDHGSWIARHWDSLNPDVRARFQTASRYTQADLAAADAVLAQARATIDAALGDAVLLLPSASSFAPLRTEAALGGAVIEAARAKTFQLTCLAGISGRCAISMPVATGGQPPAGLCMVGPRGRDRDLLALAQAVQARGVAQAG
ncbi:glutamyl-tRNA amidotransferase [Comamonas serinivorans]|uniref:Glutamyl-tRNA amidotransferase n=1 Tax=Comamonas serinivorans TaxID=1082851 RepID=A0A1Y0ESQ9_9BURK|nr:amidase [Comamonas serinivorans]ARU06704.1 glutamyl-tRNA amidotransferase [Comamonas serinivorans]